MNETELLHTLTKVVTTLDSTSVRFAVAGGLAVYARGGPPSDHDVDIFLKHDDVLEAAEQGVSPGGVPVRNVAQPVIRAAYATYLLEPAKALV